METIREVLKRRDGASDSECDERIAEANAAIAEGEDPEEVMREHFGLEPDYIWDSEIQF